MTVSRKENADAVTTLNPKPKGPQRFVGAPSGQRRRIFTGKDGFTIFLFLLPALIFVGIFTYYPMINGSQMAFRQWKLTNLTETPWIWFENFKTVLADANFATIAWNTVVWVVVSLIFQFLIGFAVALWLRNKFRFRGLYQALIFFPWAISGFLIGIMFRWMFNGEFGVVNDLLIRLGLIEKNIAWLSSPDTAMFAIIVANIWYGVTFFAIMLLAALQSVPEELYEAAALDGAGKAQTLFSVTIPYISATIALTVLLRVIWIFNFPDLIWAMTNGGPANQTHIFTTWMIQTTQKGDYGTASAMGLIVVAFLLVFAIFYLMATTEKTPKSERKEASK
ncbi:sugar ABC transporter permease [Jonesiaceae bacterium BS-20]|uniref:Sugar ABC transporter permease n=1 Tax=Jonesiaceae bacterium BS-20 TaxID=3120821 RepID=A0AAU7DR66_9MICO